VPESIALVVESNAAEVAADLLVVVVPQDFDPASVVAQLPGCDTDIVGVVEREKFTGKKGTELLFRAPVGIAANNLLLVGLGDAGCFRRAGATAARAAQNVRAGSVVAFAGDEPGDVQRFVVGFGLGGYAFDHHVAVDPERFAGVESLNLAVSREASELSAAVGTACAELDGIVKARDLVNEPPNLMYPEALAEAAVDIAMMHGLEHKVFDENDLAEGGFNLIMAVGKGSEHLPRLIHLIYRPDGEVKRKVAFVGKGVTFDTGGYNLKPSASLLNMHCDMGGAAAVLGAAHFVGETRPEGVEVHFVVPTAENAIASNAYKPQDIFRGYGGKTVEIHNTDAEGRLILADAIAYTCELGVDTLIDLATLTGSCVVALGSLTAGLFTDDDELATDLLGAADRAGEDLWRLPLIPELDEELDTPHADMKNLGSRWGGAITAALFLGRWVDGPRWAHLDIAGPAFQEKKTVFCGVGATGYGVATLAEFVRSI
jgi:leucyl aminopeptidase